MTNLKISKQLKELQKHGKDMRLAAENWKNNYETLISIILSARTRDETTIEISKKLFSKYSSINKLSRAKLKDIEKIIKPINFYKTKSKNIIECAKKLKKDFSSRVPIDFEKLVSLPGVGRKTANVFLAKNGKDKIGVDTHVSYISQKLKWTKNNDPAKIEEDLKKLFNKKDYKKINPILVKFGKTFTNRKQKDELLEKIRKIN